MVLTCLALTGASAGLALVGYARRARLDWRFAVPAPIKAKGAAYFETLLDYAPDQGQAHAPGVVVEENGFRVLWFEGSAEAQADVDVHSIMFTRSADGWARTEPLPFLTRKALGAAMEPQQRVVTLGNTIENEAVGGGLFATVASVGGWAMASIVNVRMQGNRVNHGRKLNLSPILGRSNLVKSPMVAYADGSFALPAYFEMGATFGLLARMDASGRVVDTRRMAGFGKPIQPMVVPLDEARAVAFLRDFDPNNTLLVSRTDDGGRTWSRVARSGVFNPSAPVAALGLGDGRILMAMNDQKDAPDALRLVLSEDEGATWHVRRQFDGVGALRYPMLRRLGDGDIVLSYSKGTKQGVVAHVFNQAWVDAA